MFFFFDFFFMGIVFIVLMLAMVVRVLPIFTRRFRRGKKNDAHFQNHQPGNQDVIETEFVDDPEDQNQS